jgi:hypothetical protein
MNYFLDDTDLFIKDNLDWILAGKYDDKFSKEQLDKMIELSFLYNHIHIESNTLTFRYSKLQINLTNLYEQYSELVYQIGKEAVKNMIITTITSQEQFKLSFVSFLRDKKIDKIIKE